jgi:hypothetical protein
VLRSAVLVRSAAVPVVPRSDVGPHLALRVDGDVQRPVLGVGLGRFARRRPAALGRGGDRGVGVALTPASDVRRSLLNNSQLVHWGCRNRIALFE